VQVSTAASTSLTLGSGSFAGTFAVNGTGSVILGGNYALGGLIGTGPINLGANTLTVNGAENTTYSGVLSGSGSLVKQGSGTLTLNNTGNSFSGNVTVSGGNLDTGLSAGGGTNGYMGAVNGARTVTISNGAAVTYRANNVFGGSGKTAATIPATVVDSATLNTLRFNIIGNVTLNGAALVNSIPTGTDSTSYDGYQFLGTVTVGGSVPSTISSPTSRGNHLLGGGTTTFDVADVTGDAAVDLTVSTNLRDGSGDYTGAGALAKIGAGTMLLTAANTYTGTTTISSGTLEIGGAGSLGNGSYAGDISNSGALVISSTANQTLGGVLSGTGPLTKTAASTGRLVLNGASPSYTGTITLDGGTIGGSGSVAGLLVMNGGSIAIAGGATTTSLTSNGVNFATSTAVVLDSAVVPSTVYDVLTYGAGGATNPGNLWVPARGTLNQDTTANKFTFTAGAVATRTWNTTDGVWDNYQTANFLEDDQKFSAGDTVVLNDPATASTVTLVGTLAPASVSVTNTNGYTFAGSGTISGAATLTKAGTGALAINTANSYTGGTTISAGTVTLGSATALGTGAVALNGGALNLGGQTIANAITAGGGTIGGTGTASGTIAGAVVIDSDGIVAFNNRKEYTGGTTINAGVLDLTGGGGSGGTIRGTATVNTGGTLRLDTGDATGYGGGADALTTINLVGGTLDNNQDARISGRNQTLGSAVVNMTGGHITGIEGSNLDFFGGGSALNTLASATTSTISGTAIDLRQSQGVTFTVADGDAAIDLDISSMITNQAPSAAGVGTGTNYGSNPLVKAGDGTMRISGTTNNYTGNTTVAAGVLVVDGSIATSTLTTVNSGATLAGTGTVGTLTVSGALAPGNSAGTLSVVGNVVLDVGSSLDWELDGGDNTPGGGVNDLLAISGTGAGNLTLDGTLNVTALDSDPFSTLGFDAHWTIITYTGTLTDNGLELGAMPLLPEGWGWKVDTTSQIGEVWLVVPEPSALLLGVLGLLGLLRRRRA